MGNRRLRKTIIVALVATCINIGGLLYHMYNGQQNKHSINKRDKLNDGLKKCSVTTSMEDFGGEKHRRNDLRINDAGEYQQLCGFTTISTCAELSELKYLETFIMNTKMLRKVISPLPYTSYHMTTYIIFKNDKQPTKFVQDWLDEDKKRKVSHNKCIPTGDVYPILSRAQTIWDDTESVQFTLTTECLHLSNALVVLVTIDDANVEKEFVNARMQCDENIFYKTTNPSPLHISLGYVFADIENLSNEEKYEFKQEIIELERILPKTVIMNPPKVSSHSDMKEFTAVTS